MKLSKLLVILILVFCSTMSYSQVYENIYANASVEVQNKIDNNKIQGIDILTDIESHFQIGIVGLLASERNSFVQNLESDSRIHFVLLSEDGTAITIIASGIFSIEDFNGYISTTSGVISGSSITYTVNQ